MYYLVRTTFMSCGSQSSKCKTYICQLKEGAHNFEIHLHPSVYRKFWIKNKVAEDTWQTTWSKRRVRICTIHTLILLSFDIIQMLLKIILVTFKNLFLTLWCLYPSQRVAKGMTRQSVSQSVSPVFLVNATPLKPPNRISWNFVVIKDIMCRYAFLQEMLIWSF